MGQNNEADDMYFYCSCELTNKLLIILNILSTLTF